MSELNKGIAIICFTVWVVLTEQLVYDYAKMSATATAINSLLELKSKLSPQLQHL